jgi:hypothetical protein
VKYTGLLSFMLGATDTTKSPDAAPLGIVIEIEASPHELIVAAVPGNRTTLDPWDAPKKEPETTTWVPTGPVVAEREVIAGAGEVAELNETLSNVAV